jgi:hypothetical protein
MTDQPQHDLTGLRIAMGDLAYKNALLEAQVTSLHTETLRLRNLLGWDGGDPTATLGGKTVPELFAESEAESKAARKKIKQQKKQLQSAATAATSGAT